MQEAFVYLLLNTENERYYIGYHKGTKDDGYICSSMNYEFWRDYESGMDFRRYYMFFGSTEECKQVEYELLSTNFLDRKCYNFSDGRGGFSVRGGYIGVEIDTRRIIEADEILGHFNNKKFIWYKKDKYIDLGYTGITKDIEDSCTVFGRVKLTIRQLIRRLI